MSSSAGIHLCWLGMLLICLLAPAAPFRDLHISFTQPDGTKIEIVGSGDEFYAEFETLEGYTVVFDPALKAYCYARRAADGQLISTGVEVHRGLPRTLGLAKHVRVAPTIRNKQIHERRQRWELGMEIEKRWHDRKAGLQQFEAKASGGIQTSNGIEPSPPSSTTTGFKMGLTLLIDFDDDPAAIPQSEIISFCNGDNYTGYGNNGSVKKYYQDVSNGLLVYSNVVTIYVRIPNSLHPKSFYNDTTKDSGTQANLLIRDAITIMKALPNYTTDILPTFSSVDVDGNNNVVAFNVFYAGDNGNVWSYGLWPHSWSLYNVGAQELSPGGMKVYRYQVSNVGSALEIGTFCHENGHMLCGYPDLYDYTGDSEGVGNYCLMAGGSWGGSPAGSNPEQICAYLKRASGWATTTAITSASSLAATVTAVAGANFNHFYRLQKPGVPTEYFLAECRYATGHDAAIPASGVLIWHIDELGDNSTVNLNNNTVHSNYEATVVQADNLWQLERNQNGGDARDLWYLGNGAGGYANKFTDVTTPNAHWWDGAASGLNFNNFSAPATTMGFIIGSINPTLNFVSATLSGGNGDQNLDPGECTDLTVFVRNDGTSTANNILATLTTSTPGVVVIQPTSTYPNLGAGATAANTTAFTISTAPSFVCGTPVNLSLVLDYGGGDNTNSFNLAAGGSGSNYVITQSTGAGIVPGTTDVGNHGDDVTTPISLPFAYTFYGQVFTTATLSANGNLQFSSASNAWANACLPVANFTNTIFAQWDDLRTEANGSGIFISTSGSAPNRIFNIEWRATYFSSGASLDFEVRLYESQPRFDLIYGTLNGTGSSATVGVQKDSGTFTQFECNSGGLSPGLQLTFQTFQQPCAGSSIIYVDRSYQGAATNGSICAPFRTVSDGYQASQNGNTIRLFNGNYPETVLMNKRLLLLATNGVVNIGLP